VNGAARSDRARRRPLAEHQVELVVLQGRVEDLLDTRPEAVDLVDEQDLARLEVGEDRGEVARLLDGRPEVVRSGDAHLRAMMWASVVLPSPGGP
jgi:hypothetical protein